MTLIEECDSLLPRAFADPSFITRRMDRDPLDVKLGASQKVYGRFGRPEVSRMPGISCVADRISAT